MPIFSRRFVLWQRLYQRMLLEPTSDTFTTPQVSEVVVPVLSADSLLETPTIQRNTGVDLSGSAGVPVVVFTVPDGEEWRLVQYFNQSMTANTRQSIVVGGSALDLGDPTTDTTNRDMIGFIMREGDTLRLETTGNGGDSSRTTSVVYDKVELG